MSWCQLGLAYGSHLFPNAQGGPAHAARGMAGAWATHGRDALLATPLTCWHSCPSRALWAEDGHAWMAVRGSGWGYQLRALGRLFCPLVAILEGTFRGE